MTQGEGFAPLKEIQEVRLAPLKMTLNTTVAIFIPVKVTAKQA